MKYKLHYAELNSDSDIELIEFDSIEERQDFIADKTISVKQKVFTLIIHWSENSDDDLGVYIFDCFRDIEKIVLQRAVVFSLFEWESYEDAYANALDLKELNPLCYNKK